MKNLDNFYDNMKENKAKETYVKPESEIVELELEQPILGGSAPNWEDGGTWGF